MNGREKLAAALRALAAPAAMLLAALALTAAVGRLSSDGTAEGRDRLEEGGYRRGGGGGDDDGSQAGVHEAPAMPWFVPSCLGHELPVRTGRATVACRP